MKKTTKILALMLCALMLVVGSVMGTLAYLTFTTEEVKNTFTIGNVNLGEEEIPDPTDPDKKIIQEGLDEALVTEYGESATATWTDTNGDRKVDRGELSDVKKAEASDTTFRVRENTYKLVPDHTYIKDPTIHIGSSSEACWLFVEVTNGISSIEASGDDTYKTIATQMSENGWSLVEGKTNIYAYKEIVATDAASKDIPIFNEFKISKDASNAALKACEAASIIVKAYAVQAEGIDSAKEAWSLTFGKEETTTE